jgi:hypothetical protein
VEHAKFEWRCHVCNELHAAKKYQIMIKDARMFVNSDILPLNLAASCQHL